MPQILYTPQSRMDLADIASYIARDNESAANHWLDIIDEKLFRLAAHPKMGQRRSELAANVRGFPVGNYVIFYRPIPDRIELIRVIHGARKLQRALFRPQE